MEDYKREFIGVYGPTYYLVILLGGRSLFFMNAGAYVTGEQLHVGPLLCLQAIHDNFGLI